MSLTQLDGIGFVVLALAYGAWAFYAEKRIRDLSSKLVVSEEKVKDDEIVDRVHTLSDDDLHSQMSDFLSRTDKPKT